MSVLSEGDFKSRQCKQFNSRTNNKNISLLCFFRLESPSYEVMQLEFEVDNVINLVPTQTLHWNIEYPGMQTSSRQTEKVSHLYISNADIQGIVPLAEVREGRAGLDKCGCRYLWENILAYLAAHISYAGIDSHFLLYFPSPLLLPLLLFLLLTPPAPSPSSGLIKAVKVILFTPSCGYKPPGHRHTVGFTLTGFTMTGRLKNRDTQPGRYSAYRHARIVTYWDLQQAHICNTLLNKVNKHTNIHA